MILGSIYEVQSIVLYDTQCLRDLHNKMFIYSQVVTTNSMISIPVTYYIKKNIDITMPGSGRCCNKRYLPL